MDKGKAIKVGIAVVVLIIAAVLIFRSLSGGGAGADVPPPLQPTGATPHANLIPLA